MNTDHADPCSSVVSSKRSSFRGWWESRARDSERASYRPVSRADRSRGARGT